MDMVILLIRDLFKDDGPSTLYDGTPVSPLDSTAHGDTEASLMKQLALATSKLTQLEAEREHWRLEHQLLQCKHQKEAKVCISSLYL